MTHATQLTAIVAIGIAVGAAAAGKWVRLEDSVSVLPARIFLGLIVITLSLVDD